ncbi:MAG TPA: hypothetical protein VGO78_28315, partial [Acidimicrobiales bacterium]|nr:hypothetical protein [Acidimicrobiales bacterium]
MLVAPASVTIDPGTTVSVDCAGKQDVPVGAIAFTGTGGSPSAAAPGPASLTLSGSVAATITIPVDISATVSADRSTITGTATLHLPNGFPLFCTDATLGFTASADRPYAIRTGHDGTTDPLTGFDLTHMIDKQPAGTTTPWDRCTYLWAVLPAGEPVPGSATWAVDPGNATGAHILNGWTSGAPASDPDDGTPYPLRTKVCITDATPVDSTFGVTITTPGRGLAGRVRLWVGNFVNYPGRAQGDVHNTTFDEMHYDFQGVGEYVDAVAGGGRDFAVQSRLETVPNAPVTVTTATSMQVSLARWTPKDHLNIDELVL